MSFLVTGDSWSVGEHQNTRMSPILNTNGLAECLSRAGHSVVNIGVNGSSNSLTADNLKFFLDKNRHIKFSKIFVFQTEFSRCLQTAEQINSDLKSLQNQYISQFYLNLSTIGQQFNCHIYLIGGCSDTLWLENFDQEYSNVSIACQSLTNLLLTGDHRIDSPVLDMYNHPMLPLVELIKKHSNTPQTEFLLASMAESINRRNMFDHNQKWFYPDGTHPNQTAFNQLYSFLINQGIVAP